MRKILITGVSGFVARHFMDWVGATVPQVEILGIDIAAPVISPELAAKVKFQFRGINLLEKERVDQAVREFVPDGVLHLAAFSSVGFSWKNPVDCFCNNTNIFLNLAESLRKFCAHARLLSVGSSQEYGLVQGLRKIKESTPLHPSNPYGIARVSQEMLAAMYGRKLGLNIVLTRSFNHVGVGQKPVFVIPSYVKQFAAARANGSRSLDLKAGNVNVMRDFTDVRDVVRAYAMLLQKGRPGEIYNICSGRGVSLREVISLLEKMTGIQARIVVGQELLRPDDPPKIVGDYSKIRKETGWEPHIPLRDTLAEMLNAEAG